MTNAKKVVRKMLGYHSVNWYLKGRFKSGSTERDDQEAIRRHECTNCGNYTSKYYKVGGKHGQLVCDSCRDDYRQQTAEDH